MEKKKNRVIITTPDDSGELALLNAEKRHHYVLKMNFSVNAQMAFFEALNSCLTVLCMENPTSHPRVSIISYNKQTGAVFCKSDLVELLQDILESNYESKQLKR